VIFARSRRLPALAGISGLLVATCFGFGAWLLAERPRDAIAAGALAVAALIGAAIAVWAAWRLRSWPPRRLAFFRDRLVVLEGRAEFHAPWDRIETATLAEPAGVWEEGWPEARISDRLTVRLRRGKPVGFRPADFGLDPTGCRDFILRLRDDRGLRSRLPEFDSALDLSERPLVTGELITPRL
jgi:hypothetical protein